MKILITRRHVSASGGHHQVKIRVSWRGGGLVLGG